jgi:putative alpha-1,2-mannosidase
MEFSRPFESYGTAVDDQILKNQEVASGKNIKAFVRYNTSKGKEVLVKVGISAVSIEGARKNLEAEIPHWDFEQTHREAVQTWKNALGKIKVEGGSKEQRTIFYTALYHTLIHPGIYMDVDGQYRGMDLEVHQAGDFTYYSVYSLWDTYRALHPLFTIIEPERNLDMIRTLLAKYDEHDLLPVWELASNETGTMIGYHSVPVIVDAYMKGFRDFDLEKAYEAVKRSADQDHLGLKSYKELGYVASKLEHQSVSKTLEYAYDDWCIAMMAGELGKQEDYESFSKRAKNYMNLFDGYGGFMRGKNQQGTFEPFFNPIEVIRDFTEANAWQYSMYVPHDINGLINLHGGKEKFCKKIDEVFSTESKLEGKSLPDITGLIGQYAHGNEPSHHMAYLYNYAGQGWKTQERIREIMDIMYTSKPDGLSGNEDCGQMSAWYVLSALGFYPVSPGTGQYIFGSPVFEEALIELGNGDQFTIKASNVSRSNKYIQSVSLNGQPYTRTYLEHTSIVWGDELVFEMGPKPNKDWGRKSDDLPYSFSDGSIVSPPYQKTDAIHFESSALVDLASRTDGAEIRYTLDGSKPGKRSKLFTDPFQVHETTLIKARAYKDNLEPSRVTKIEMNKLVYRDADRPGNVINGLWYDYFEGPFRSVRDIAGIRPLTSGIVSNFSLDEAEAEDHFAFRYTGYIKIPAEGLYRFYTRSDDGSVLFIGDTEVVNNDGSHGSLESSGIIALQAGYHPIKVLYFEDYEGQSLMVLMEGPEIEKHRIPEALLFRKK